MLRDGWNFHGDIAISLETIACSYFGIVYKQNETILYASCIESYSFAEVMIELLRSKTNYSSEYPEIDSFVEK